MWSNLIFTFFLVAAVLAIGDILALKTKGLVIGIVVINVVYIAGYLTGIIPTTTPADLGLSPIVSGYITILMITHMGTTISLKRLGSEWRTVAVCFVALLVMIAVVLTLGAAIFGFDNAAAATGPISGGFVATMLTSNAATAAGKENITPLIWMVGIIQQLVGIPVTSLVMRFYIKGQIKQGAHLEKLALSKMEEDPNYRSKFRFLPDMPDKFNTPYMILAKLALVTLLASLLETVTNKVIPSSAAALVLGVIFCEIGFLDKNALTKAGLMNFVLFAMLAVVPQNFASITVESLSGLLGATLGLLAVGIVGLAIGSFIMSKVLKIHPLLAICCGFSALYGFPTTMLITEGVIKGAGLPEDQAQNLLDRTVPQMVVAGFTTVTIGSVLIMGFLVNYIF